MTWLVLALGALGLCALFLFAWRLADRRADDAAWNSLVEHAGPAGPAFDVSTIAELPEPARRYFRYTIAPGTRLVSAVEIDMKGRLGLGTKTAPAYRAMTAEQLLAPPWGLVWKVGMGSISGSDAATPDTSWTRFWLLDLIPIVRVSGSADHRRSAFGRVLAEGAFWAPASLLPSGNVTWEAVGANTARAIVAHGAFSQSIDLTVEPDGRPSRVVIQRWSNANATKKYREQPFGGYLSDFREIGGYQLPMHVEGGNLIGTGDYFPFYIADVERIGFPQLAAGSVSTAQ